MHRDIAGAAERQRLCRHRREYSGLLEVLCRAQVKGSVPLAWMLQNVSQDRGGSIKAPFHQRRQVAGAPGVRAVAAWCVLSFLCGARRRGGGCEGSPPRRDRRHDCFGTGDWQGHAPPPRPGPIPASSTSTSNTTVASLAQRSQRRRPQGAHHDSTPARPTTSCRPLPVPPLPCPTTSPSLCSPTHASCPDPDPADPPLLFRRRPCRGSAMLLSARHRLLNSKHARGTRGTREGSQGTLRL